MFEKGNTEFENYISGVNNSEINPPIMTVNFLNRTNRNITMVKDKNDKLPFIFDGDTNHTVFRDTLE